MPKQSGTTTSSPDHDRERFGKVLGEALFARSLTQADLAKMCHTTQSAVSSWIHAKAEPAATLVFLVERKLDLPAGFLSRLLGYLPVEVVASVPTIEEAVQSSTMVAEDFKPMLLAVVREMVKASRPLQSEAVPVRSARARRPS